MQRRNGPSEDVVNSAKIDYHATDRLRFDDETFADNDALIKSLAPILRILTFAGSHVQVYHGRSTMSHGMGKGKQKSSKGSKFAAKYSVVFMTIVWINVVRLLTAFTARDKFDELLINKLVIVSSYLQSAVVTTSCVFASYTGQLDQFLRLFRVTTHFVGVARRITTARIVFYQMWCIVYIVLFIYTIYFTQGSYDFLMAPLVTVVPIQVNDIWFHVTKAVCVVLNLMSLLGYLWPRVLNQILIEMLKRQFQIINKRFCDATTRRGRFKGSVRMFRNRHLAIVQAIRTVDRFSMAMNAASSGGNTFILIILLYAFIFMNFSNPAVFGTSLYMLASSIMSVAGLILLGTLVNNSAHELSSRIHDIDMAELDEDEIRELLMFEKHLSSNSIGFSVFGLFVIDRTTAPKLLGLLLTYFLLIVQMSPPVSSHDSNVSNSLVTSTTTTTTLLMAATNNTEDFCKSSFFIDACERCLSR